MTNPFSIRPAQLTDLPQIYEICLRTGDNGNDATGLLRDDLLVGQFFAAPYLHYQCSSCFVIDQAGFAVGYVIGVLDTREFNAWLNQHWLPHLAPAYPPLKDSSDLENYVIDTIHNGMPTPPYAAQFPSHLHIDLLPCAQGKGLGRKLIETFIDYIASQGSTGLHLGVGVNNQSAIEFYQRIGLQTFQKDDSVCTMTKALG